MADKVTDAAGHVLSLGTIVGAVTDHLPGIATAFAIIWYGMQAYDWIAAKVAAHRARKQGGTNATP